MQVEGFRTNYFVGTPLTRMPQPLTKHQRAGTPPPSNPMNCEEQTTAHVPLLDTKIRTRTRRALAPVITSSLVGAWVLYGTN